MRKKASKATAFTQNTLGHSTQTNTNCAGKQKEALPFNVCKYEDFEIFGTST